MSRINEVAAALEAIPHYYPPPDVVHKQLEDFKVSYYLDPSPKSAMTCAAVLQTQFIDDQVDEQLLKRVSDTGAALSSCDPSVEEKLESVTHNLLEAYIVIRKKVCCVTSLSHYPLSLPPPSHAILFQIDDKQELFEEAVSKWDELDKKCAPFFSWASTVRAFTERTTYGSSLEELQQTLSSVQVCLLQTHLTGPAHHFMLVTRCTRNR